MPRETSTRHTDKAVEKGVEKGGREMLKSQRTGNLQNRQQAKQQ